MKYDFDKVVDRIHTPYQYSVKWVEKGGMAEMIKGMCGLDTIPADRIALFTADMDFKCSPAITEALTKTAQHGIFGYSSAPQEYYEAVSGWFARHYDWHFAPNRVIIDPAATHHIIANCVQCYTKPGEGVIVLIPSYGYHGDIEPLGRKFVGVPFIEKDAYFSIDFDAFEKACADPNNTMFIAMQPHNPTGRVFTVEEIKRLGEICERNGVLILTDEVHIDLNPQGADIHPMMQVLGGKNCIAATGVNKTFNLAGLAMSNLIIDDDKLMKQYLDMVPMAYMGSCSPFGISAVIAAYNESDEWVEELNKYLKTILDYVVDRFHKDLPKVRVNVPEATYILWLDFSGLGLSDEELNSRLASTGVLIGDGAGMEPQTTPHQWRRICLTCPMVQCVDMMDRFVKVFDDVK